MNKIRVAATELQQLRKQKTNIFEEATGQKPLKCSEKIKLLKVHEGTCPNAPYLATPMVLDVDLQRIYEAFMPAYSVMSCMRVCRK